MSASTTQALTGVVVNRVLSAGRKRLQEIHHRIYELSTRPSRPPDHELRSVASAIAHVRTLNELQGAALERYALRVLPPTQGKPKKQRKNAEYRPCRCTDRHATPHRREPAAGAPVVA
jgi:hypothetical protein